ncbi:hypothetical protein IEQ34_017792 [Dendrobium chrysotoxum]|uniref:Zinc transporter n=1 Tax=Dendrobium chrysotoxum TaxID=161865 RepID=A0AAV7GDL0_DENCH|nr:hypothetical protein IEQ34_017792 [Dendrobium chrysotoxum]
MDAQILVALALSFVGGLSTSAGALLVILNPTPNLKMLGLLQFFAGVLFFAFIVNFIPEPTATAEANNIQKDDDGSGKDMMKKHRRDVLFSGIITAVGISLHNFPEGMAVFLGSIKGLRVGLNLALAIALHNIPEGVAVALPVYFATQSKWKAFKLASLSGFAEPLGVVIVGMYIFDYSYTIYFCYYLTFITFHVMMMHIINLLHTFFFSFMVTVVVFSFDFILVWMTECYKNIFSYFFDVQKLRNKKLA